MRVLVWLLRAFIFFALFAFALNNQQLATVHWFFGVEWQAPMVIVVLAAFSGGCAIGVMAMMPTWWRHRRAARRQADPADPARVKTLSSAAVASDFVPEHPPREGL